jgi:hypothetical protein
MKNRMLALSFLLCSAVLFSQNDKGNPYTADFGILVQSMRELYPMIGKTISKEQFEVNVKETNGKLLKAKDQFQAAYLIQCFTYAFGDQHTGTNVFAMKNDQGPDKLLPFSVYIIRNELFIKNYSANTSLNGSKILSIDGVLSKALVDTMKVFVSSDGNRVDQYYPQTMFNRLYGSFISQRDTFIVVTDKGPIHLPCVNRRESAYAELAAYNGAWKKYMVTDTLRARKVITADYGYFRSFSFEKKEEGFNPEKEFNVLMKEMNDKQVANLIIDLRYNGGGNPNMAGRMASHLISKPFRVFERLILTPAVKPSYRRYMLEKRNPARSMWGLKKRKGQDERVRFDPGLKITQPTKNGYKGKIFILTGPKTASAATMFCKYLVGQENVVFVGAETPGAINYFCAHAFCFLKLPNTGLIAQFGMELIELKKGSSETEKPLGIIPDKQIDYTIQELLAGKDKEMEWVLNQIQKR